MQPVSTIALVLGILACEGWAGRVQRRASHATTSEHSLQQEFEVVAGPPPSWKALAALLLAVDPASALRVPSAMSGRSVPQSPAISRRDALQQTAGLALGATVAGASLPAIAFDDIDDMGGYLVPYIDRVKNFKMFRIFGMNEFSALPGSYDIKWQDIIETDTQVLVSTSPVEKATSVAQLGDPEAVAAKLAEPRKATVVKATASEDAGYTKYTIELKGDILHELHVLTVNRGKLYRLWMTCDNSRWNKREKGFKLIGSSFIPQA